MKQYFSFLLFTLLAGSLKAQPPNNPIFTGGVGDGMSNASWLIASANIFAGGAGDGESYAANASLPNPIYLGGEGDGFSFNTNSALPNNIFYGGEGDGWHAVVLPLGPLPVELLTFTAEHAGTSHLVKWTTAEEINTRHFEVQRSHNARDFVSIGTVLPPGSSTHGASYTFAVEEPFEGNNFYRLKIIDNDGSFTYSNIVLLKNEGRIKMSLFPNPTTDAINISIPSSSDAGIVSASIYDAQGRLIMQSRLSTGILNTIELKKLPAGIYTLRSIIEKQPVSVRFMKQ